MENNMKEVRIVNGPINSPAIVLGCMRMPVLSPKEAANIIAAAMDLGVNFFDNATVYTDGEAEKRFGEGKALLGIPREKMIIQTKCGLHFRDRQAFDWSEKDIIESVEGSLKRMELDYLDVLLLHRPDVLYEPEEVAAAFDKLYYSGKVRYFGVSNLMPLQIALLKKYVRQPLVINQLQLSLEQSQLIDQTLNEHTRPRKMSLDRDNNTLDYCRIRISRSGMVAICSYGFNAAASRAVLSRPSRFPLLNKALHELGASTMCHRPIAIAWYFAIRQRCGHRRKYGFGSSQGYMRPPASLKLTRDEWYKLYIAAGKYLPEY
jgi:predicted oxidoreductase